MLRSQQHVTVLRAKVRPAGHGEDDEQGQLPERGAEGSEVRQYHRRQQRG